ncbi:MAG: carbamoyltransferase HypF, partial [Acetobacteraceae bacterium]
IRVRGLVQGVGFRPTVWRLARVHGLRGWVGNDGDGVTAHVCGQPGAIAAFVGDLADQPPPLARIDRIERHPAAILADDGFRIVASRVGAVHTAIVPDAATCEACLREIRDPLARRYRYPFTNCTHCGPRLSIIEAIPYDRATTTMRAFALCAECRDEYEDPSDRRFHAQPIGCPKCGPRVRLTPASSSDPIEAARQLLLSGHVIAVKGLGGFQIACDATDESAVGRLRLSKRREAKPFALMARDVEMIRRYCAVSAREATALRNPAAPIVVLDQFADRTLAASIAPGLGTLGFMLPNTPLHHLLLAGIDAPIVLTSGNPAGEPQCIADDEAAVGLAGIADHLLTHDRDIARRVDDSVVRLMGGTIRVLRRARGHAPAPIALPPGFADVPVVLAMGGELKNSFCLLRGGQAILSHHIGDLENSRTFDDYARSIEHYAALFEHDARIVAIDPHPEYLSSKLGIENAERDGRTLVEVQHHHAHVASCMAENGVARDAPPVLGVALDGLGFGADCTLWGGEFLLADYRGFRRLARFKPIAMPGGARAIEEPWRNTYAHIVAAIGWEAFAARYGETELFQFLSGKPLATFAGMIARGVNAPLASSCGRLFDAVAAASGVCREHALYEGQAAAEFEALASTDLLRPYPFALVSDADGLLVIEPRPMWRALLDDLAARTPLAVVSARFHAGLAAAICETIRALRRDERLVLSGGVFQNRTLLEQVVSRLIEMGVDVLTHREVPANDGGLALGQAVVAAARSAA